MVLGSFFDELKRKASEMADDVADSVKAANMASSDEVKPTEGTAHTESDDQAKLTEDIATMQSIVKVLRESGMEEEARSVEADIESIRADAVVKGVAGKGGTPLVQNRDTIVTRINELKKDALEKEGTESGGEEVEALWKEVGPRYYDSFRIMHPFAPA